VAGGGRRPRRSESEGVITPQAEAVSVKREIDAGNNGEGAAGPLRLMKETLARRQAAVFGKYDPQGFRKRRLRITEGQDVRFDGKHAPSGLGEEPADIAFEARVKSGIAVSSPR
jgi:hypothetical protein